MNPTHERIPRLAECIQWDGSNTQQVSLFLTAYGLDGELWREYLMVRDRDGRIVHTIWRGGWVLEGEDGKIRFYTDYTFKSMYRLVRSKLAYLPSMTDEELISYLESVDGVSEVESQLVERLKNALDREYDSGGSIYLTAAEREVRQGTLNSMMRTMLDNANINTTKGE